MRRLLQILFFLLVFSYKVSYSQITYFHYYDSTSKWLTYIEGVYFGGCMSLIASFSFITDYMSGDTMLGGKWYYNVHTIRKDSMVCTADGTTTVDIFSYYKMAIREDSLKKVYAWSPSDSSESLLWDFNIFLGDTIEGCIISAIDTVWLGAMPLRRFHCPCDTISFILEGAGKSRVPFCGGGIESNLFLICYYKQNDVLEVLPNNQCGSIITVMQNRNISSENSLMIYPNPTSWGITISVNAVANGGELLIYNIIGEVVRSIPLRKERQNYSFNTNELAGGVYFVKFVQEGVIMQIQKIVVVY